MKLNPDCIRDILLKMEDTPYQEDIYPDQLYETLPDYAHDEIDYTILKMNEAGFISATIQKYLDGSVDITIHDITYNGHQFLANIRSNNIWNNVKEVSKKVGSNSLSAISQIATGVITEIIKSQLGLL